MDNTTIAKNPEYPDMVIVTRYVKDGEVSLPMAIATLVDQFKLPGGGYNDVPLSIALTTLYETLRMHRHLQKQITRRSNIKRLKETTP